MSTLEAEKNPQEQYSHRSKEFSDFIGDTKPHPSTSVTHRRGRKYTLFKTFDIISSYNFKGGVGKTILSFELGCMLARDHVDRPPVHEAHPLSHYGLDGPGVLLVDLDPQCSLTKLSMTSTVKRFNEEANHLPVDDFEHYFRTKESTDGEGRSVRSYRGRHTVFQAIGPQMFDGFANHAYASLQPALLTRINIDSDTLYGTAPDSPAAKKPKTRATGSAPRLYILPGDLKMDLVSTKLEIASEDSRFEGKLGVLYHMLWMTAAFYNIHTIILDLPPNLGGITRVGLLSSHYFYLPVIPDTFSNDAIKSLTDLLADDDPPQQAVMDGDEDGDEDGDAVQLDRDSEEYFMFRLSQVAVGRWKTWLERILTPGGPNETHRYWFPDHTDPRYRRRPFATRGPKLIGALMTMFEPQWTRLSSDDVVDPAKFNCPPVNRSLGPVAHIVKESKPLLLSDPQEFDRRMRLLHSPPYCTPTRSEVYWHQEILETLTKFRERAPSFVLPVSQHLRDRFIPSFPILVKLERENNQRISQRNGIPIHLLGERHLEPTAAAAQLTKQLMRLERFRWLVVQATKLIRDIIHENEQPERDDEMQAHQI
jgi:cellulose biosynthesis protein BcsQ